MNPTDRQPEYRVTLRFSTNGVPALVRLRRFLKMARRAYGLRAVRIEEVPDVGPDPSGQGGAKPG